MPYVLFIKGGLWLWEKGGYYWQDSTISEASSWGISMCCSFPSSRLALIKLEYLSICPQCPLFFESTCFPTYPNWYPGYFLGIFSLPGENPSTWPQSHGFQTSESCFPLPITLWGLRVDVHVVRLVGSSYGLQGLEDKAYPGAIALWYTYRAQ